MAINRTADDRGREFLEVDILPEQDVQCARVQDDLDTDAYALWFFEPTQPLAENELAGKYIDPTMMKGETVVLRFSHSPACLKVIEDLTIIYGNLVKAGV